MGKSSPSAPAAPDPYQTAAAQTQTNKDTALFNFGLNNPTVNTPLGSSSYTVSNSAPQYDMDAYNKALDAYSQQGNNTTVDRLGNVVSAGRTSSPGVMPKLSDFMTAGGTPQATQNITLSPDQQKLYDLYTNQSIGLGNLATQLQGRVGDTLNQPLPTDIDINSLSKNASDAYLKKQMGYLQPQQDLARSQLANQLANQGVMSGSEAYKNAMDQMNRDQTFQNDQAQQNAILAGPQNAQALFGLTTQNRDLPLNEFNSVRTGAQVNMPSFSGTTPSSAQPANISGDIYNSYNANMNAYNQQQAQQNAMSQGLFGIAGNLGSAYLGSTAGSAALTAFMSDVRLKSNIKYIGKEGKYDIYSFHYKGDPDKITYRGVMAQDVRNITPDAVIEDGGYLKVDYAKIGVEFGRIH